MSRQKVNSPSDPKTPLSKELQSERQAQPVAHHQSEPSAEEATLDEEAIKATEYEEAVDSDVAVPAEVAAIHLDPASVSVAEEAVSKLKRRKIKKVERQTVRAAKVASSAAVRAPKSARSRRMLAAKAKIEPGKLYPLEEAITLTKQLALAKFDGAIELHLGLIAKKAQADSHSTRGQFNLPHGTGKEKKIIVLTGEKIEEIAKTKKIDFDVALASPALMPQVAKIARILGPRGKMPDPKSGTVTDDPEAVAKQIQAGKVEYRLDGSNVHQIIGRVSWPVDNLLNNAKAVIGLIGISRLRTIFVTSSIGPSVPVKVK